jgi:type VI secretion system protein ImpA
MIFNKSLNDFLIDISGSSPVGTDLKYDPVYDKIQESLREDLDLPQGVWVQDLKVADWRGAETLCADTLQKQTKDLQIAGWLVEIWMSLYQMPGLNNGLDLVLKLSEKYWDTIYPLSQDGDTEFRMAPFLWLNEKLSKRTHRIIVTDPVNATVGPQTFAQYLAIRDYLHQKETPPATLSQNLNDFQTSLARTSSDFFRQLHKDTQETIAITQKIESFLDAKFGRHGPTLYHMREALGEFTQYCEQTLGDRGESLIEEKQEEKVEGNSSVSNPLPEAPAMGGPIKSRDDAYRVIQEAADYLYKIEPHSPTPFLIRKAISWGHLSFEQLMNEVVQDQGSVADMRRLLGLDSAGRPAPQLGVDNTKTGQQPT